MFQLVNLLIKCIRPLFNFSCIAYACLRRKEGFENVKYLGEGGIIGYTLVFPDGLVKEDGSKTAQLHTFMQGLAGLAADGLETLYFVDAQDRLIKLTNSWNEKLKA